MQNINNDKYRGPTRKTKVSQELWAASLEIKQEEPGYYSMEREMEQTTSYCYKEPNSPAKKVFVNTKVPKTALTSEVFRKAEKKPKGFVPTAETSSTKEKLEGSAPTPKISIKMKLPVERNPTKKPTEKLVTAVQSAEGARSQVNKEQVKEDAKKRLLVSQVSFSGDINRLYHDAYLATRLDEDYLTKAWVESDRECPWFCGKGSSDVVFPVYVPGFGSPDYDSALTVLGVRLDALDKLSGFI